MVGRFFLRAAVKATLVIPTYNRCQRLAELLRCVAEREGDHLARVVVCDDGSSDDTAAVAQSFADRLPLHYVTQEDRGFRAGQARNLGIERATGDVVVFVDDDVLVRPDFVAQHLRAHQEQGPGPSVAIGHRHRTPTFGGDVPTTAEILAAERDDRVADLEGAPVTSHESPWIFTYSCNLSVTLGGPELYFDDGFEGWGLEDTELGYRLHHAGYAIVDAPFAQVLHVDDPAPRDPLPLRGAAATTDLRQLRPQRRLLHGQARERSGPAGLHPWRPALVRRRRRSLGEERVRK